MSAGPVSKSWREVEQMFEWNITCGVTRLTFDAFAAAGIHPEPYSPMQGLMVCYDDVKDDEVRALLLYTAMQINALTPFACCAMKDES